MGLISFRGVLFLFLGFIAVIGPTAPISNSPSGIETPDILLCLIFSWVVYDPRSASVWSILALCLLADILWLRPLGLWSMLTLIASELVRHYRLDIIKQSILTQSFYFLIYFCLINAGVQLIYVIGVLKSLDFTVWLKYFLVTCIAFPILNLALVRTIFRREKII